MFSTDKIRQSNLDKMGDIDVDDGWKFVLVTRLRRLRDSLQMLVTDFMLVIEQNFLATQILKFLQLLRSPTQRREQHHCHLIPLGITRYH